MIVISKEDLICKKKSQMNEVQNFANFHTCYLPYGLEFFHKGHPKNINLITVGLTCSCVTELWAEIIEWGNLL